MPDWAYFTAGKRIPDSLWIIEDGFLKYWKQESEHRLNSFAGRIDAEKRKLTPAEKKEAKPAFKSLEEHVRQFRGKIDETFEKMDSCVKDNDRDKATAGLKEVVTRFNVEWQLFLRQCEVNLPALKIDWFQETAFPDGVYVAPLFEEVDQLKAQYVENDWMGEMTAEGRRIWRECQMEMDDGVDDETMDEALEEPAVEDDGDGIQGDDVQGGGEDGEAGAIGSDGTAESTPNNSSQPDKTDDGLRMRSLRKCDRENCLLIESNPREFQVCAECRKDSKRAKKEVEE